MTYLFVKKYIDYHIRNDLGMSVRADIYPILDEKIKQLIQDAKQRSELDNKKTIMAKHL